MSPIEMIPPIPWIPAFAGMTRLHIRISIFLLAGLLMAPVKSSSAGFLKVQGTAIVDSSGQEILLRGFGPGGWLVPEGYQVHIPGTGSPTDIRNKIIDLIGAEAAERFYGDYVRNYAAEEDFRTIASWGCNSIRLPFDHQMFEPEGQIGIRPEDPFAFLDRILGWCGKYRLYLIFDMHCAPGGQNHGNISDSDGTARLWTDSANRDRTVEIWRRIAERYADEPWVGGYDLLNEPVLPSGHTYAELRTLYIRIAQAIREADPNHILFIEGNWWASDFSGLAPAFDQNLVYSFHKYWDAPILSTIQKYISLRQTAKRPLWLGETGENSNAWFTACVRLLEQNKIGWNWWTHKKVEALTCPYSSPIASDFQAVLNYWGGTGARPSRSSAESALMDMADRLKIERCDFRPDVVDALLRQPSDRTAVPYRPVTLPGTIPAAKFDLGEPGIAYSDKVFLNQTGDPGGSAWNSGYRFRNDGVDIEESGNAAVPFDVGWIDAGEWLQYTADVPVSGTYETTFAVASTSSSGRFRLLMDGTPLTGALAVSNTGGWKQWKTVRQSGLEIPAGRHAFRFEAVAGGFNLLSLEFKMTRPSDVVSSEWISVTPEVRCRQNYPNPFNGSTTMPFLLTEAQNVTVKIFDVRGGCVRVLKNGRLESGYGNLLWDGNDESSKPVPSGVYLARVQAGSGDRTVKLILQR